MNGTSDKKWIKQALDLPVLFSETSSSENGVAVNSYGKGQVTGAIYTVPAHGEITLDFNVIMSCVTADDVQQLNNFIRGLLDVSKYHSYDELENTNVNGGVSFFGFFSGGANASYSKTKHTMDGWGLSEENQKKIVEKMMEIAIQKNEFNYKGTVHNKDFDYDVTGSIFAIVMDAEIQNQQFQKQLRFIGKNLHLQSEDGAALPVIGKLYD